MDQQLVQACQGLTASEIKQAIDASVNGALLGDPEVVAQYLEAIANGEDPGVGEVPEQDGADDGIAEVPIVS